MLKNYLIILFRQIVRQKANSFINLSGLALGISTSLFIVLYIQSELSYEKDYPKADHLYRLASNNWAKSSPPIKDFISDYFPAIKNGGRLAAFMGSTNVAVIGNNHFPIRDGYYADQSILQLYNRSILSGDNKACLERPYTIVLTKSLATTLYADENPVGKTIKFAFGSMENEKEYEITAVIEDFPKNSHLRIGYLVSMPTFYKNIPESWSDSRTWMVMYTYLEIDDEQELTNIRSNLRDFSYDYLIDNFSSREILDSRNDFYELHPIKQIHLFSHREQEMGPNGNISYVYIFGALAVLIILIASANFINMYITMALKRSKEVGIRKVNGATQRKLFMQFLLESFFYSFMALLFAFIICAFAMPMFNSIANQNYVLTDLMNLNNSLSVIVIVITVALLSGLYPALFISGFRVVDSIKINQIPRSSLSYTRKLLIVIQFSISLFMIISTMIISDQLQYIQKKDLGFDRENTMFVYTYGDFAEALHQNREFIYNELLKNPDIIKVGVTSNTIGQISSVEYLQPDGKEIDFTNTVMRFFRSDEGMIPALGIELKEGRNFIPELDSGGAFIINERVVDMLDLDHPLGTNATNSTMGTKGQIVGVMKDFNFASLHNEIEPLVLTYRPNWANTIILKISGNNLKETISYIENMVKTMAPGSLFAYDFLNNHLNGLYVNENKMIHIFTIFSIFAIIISCMGLYGLAAYTAELRTKEIGIRKAFGASLYKILAILSTVYFKLIFISLLIAIPVSNYFITEWLKNFAYHVPVKWWIFVLAGMAVTLIAFAAIINRSYKAACNSPSIALRSE